MSREKNRALRKFSTILLLLLLSVGAWAQGDPPPGGGMPPGMFGVDTSKPTSTDVTTYTAQNFLSLVHQTDIRSSFYDSDMTATITMVSVSPEKGTMTRKEIIYRRDKDDAFLMLTLEPESRKGQGMLRVDNNMWRYDPTSRKFTHTTLKDQYEDTTVRNNDFRRSQRALDYSVTSLTSGTLGKYNVWIKEKD